MIRRALPGLVVAVPLFPELFWLDGLTPFTQLTAFRPQGIVVLGLVGVLAQFKRPLRPAGAVVLGLAVIAAALTAPRVLSDAKREDGARQLTIMAVNVLGGGAPPAKTAEVIRERRPAFVALPEAQEDVRRRIEAELDGYRGYTVQTTRAPVSATSVLVSTELGEVRFGTDSGVTSFGNVIVTAGRIRLVAYHSAAPLIGDTEAWRQDKGALKRWCAQGPTIVAGDFNASLDHAPLREALEGCHTAAAKVGKGLTGTWPAERPAVFRTQIDHVVGTKDLTATGFTTYEIEGTDHLAVVATLAVPPN